MIDRGIYDNIEYGGSPAQTFVYHYTQPRETFKNQSLLEMDFFTGFLKDHEHTISRATLENIIKDRDLSKAPTKCYVREVLDKPNRSYDLPDCLVCEGYKMFCELRGDVKTTNEI